MVCFQALPECIKCCFVSLIISNNNIKYFKLRKKVHFWSIVRYDRKAQIFSLERMLLIAHILPRNVTFQCLLSFCCQNQCSSRRGLSFLTKVWCVIKLRNAVGDSDLCLEIDGMCTTGKSTLRKAGSKGIFAFSINTLLVTLLCSFLISFNSICFPPVASYSTSCTSFKGRKSCTHTISYYFPWGLEGKLRA